ncbi:MAG: hypothetical protein IJ995_04775 [Clostridia bacterium]|nr:hypothetical protein [Clostridia bacterium]
MKIRLQFDNIFSIQLCYTTSEMENNHLIPLLFLMQNGKSHRASGGFFRSIGPKGKNIPAICGNIFRLTEKVIAQAVVFFVLSARRAKTFPQYAGIFLDWWKKPSRKRWFFSFYRPEGQNIPAICGNIFRLTETPFALWRRVFSLL